MDNRRMNNTFEIRHGPHRYTATVGYYLANGVFRPGEVFLNCGKAGTDLDVATRDSAVAVSFALQHGCTPETMRAAFLRDAEGRPEGVLGQLMDMMCGLEGGARVSEASAQAARPEDQASASRIGSGTGSDTQAARPEDQASASRIGSGTGCEAQAARQDPDGDGRRD